jgi:hypothetical protein
MYHLATLFPAVRRLRLPLTRDQLMLLMTAINEIFLSIDVYLAHSMSGTIKPNEWIPIIFGAVAGVLLLLAGLIALRYRPLATVIANLVFLCSIIVGLLGFYFHLQRAGLLTGAVAPVNALVWAPPFLGPLFFGISAAWVEDPPDSGQLVLLGQRRIRLPYSKTSAYCFIVSIGILSTVISSSLDHARVQFINPWVWLPTVVGIFGTIIALVLGLIRKPTRADLTVYVAAMVLLMIVGLLGGLLHIGANLLPGGTVVIERFIRGSPVLAPFVYANWGLIGLIALLSPVETAQTAESASTEAQQRETA